MLDDDGFVAVPDDVWAAEERHGWAMIVVACPLCDDDGYRGGAMCDHVDHTPAAKRGMAAVRAAMGWTV